MEKLFTVRFDQATKTEISPKKILEEQCRYLNEDTNGIVIGRVAEYPKNIDSYFTFSISADSVAGKSNLQKMLGEIGKEKLTYEFFLTSKGTPDYKFRVMFMQYDITGYPITIVLEEGIAAEIDYFNTEYIYQLKEEREFKDLLKKIFNSERLMGIVTKLMWSNDN